MIPLQELRDELRLGNVRTDDSLLMRYEREAVAYLERETGRYFGPVKSFTHTLSAHGWLPEVPIGGTLVLTDPLGTVIDAGSYTIADRSLDLGWYRYRAPLTVTYSAGYEPGQEPAEVRDAVMELVKRKYNARTKAEAPAASEFDAYLARLIATLRRPTL